MSEVREVKSAVAAEAGTVAAAVAAFKRFAWATVFIIAGALGMALQQFAPELTTAILAFLPAVVATFVADYLKYAVLAVAAALIKFGKDKSAEAVVDAKVLEPSDDVRDLYERKEYLNRQL